MKLKPQHKRMKRDKNQKQLRAEHVIKRINSSTSSNDEIKQLAKELFLIFKTIRRDFGES